MMPALVTGSRLPVGSSASRICGLFTMARAIATRCCSPPESSCGHPLALAVEADELERLGHGRLDEAARLADDPQGERDVLEDRLVRQQPEVLEDDAEVAAEVGHLAARDRAEVLPEHVDLALRGLLLLEDEPEEARLAGARRADEEDELATEDLDPDVVQGGPRLAGVGLGDGVESDHRVRA